MKAAVVPETGAKLEIRDRPVPEPGPGQVLVRMLASGLCHTDVHLLRGDWPLRPRPSTVPGHEGVGVVEELGPGASLHRPGERVAISWLGSACGHCEHCVSGWENLCEDQCDTGCSADGTFAEYTLADDRYAVAVPEELSAVDAAALTCAGTAAFRAVKVSRLAAGELVAVFGVGGLGHLAIQYARMAGGRVVAVDVDDEKLDLARRVGADHLVDARFADPSVEIGLFGGAGVAVALAPSAESVAQAYRSLRRGGRLVCVALPARGALTVPLFDAVTGGKTVTGSIGGTRRDTADVFALHAAGRTCVVAETRALEDVNTCLAELRAGEIPARVVLDLGASLWSL
ncbi:alcohol dehydrogenase catalytic domain-containing protein [Amycolatopsis sp. ATCC 39116]|uniref:alcohol dehydrogenase catalytic domain-containing protein n=1 Tax=Amycolatopsis sp. (strain ATCC 39116 / 75iv2) TaxID=385957 RepID=UPI000262795D|nr:zinc-dependent alcohol dehydrogenase [Amycolatopsis sp. ATCC 39116]